MKEYEVWIEGYAATGQSGRHDFVGKVKAKNFKEACAKAMWKRVLDCYFGDEGKAKEEYDRYYDKERNSYWGCRFFDNEEESARSFG